MYSFHHGLAAKVMENGDFRPSLDLRNPLTDFHETWNLKLSPEIPTCEIKLLSDDVGGLGEQQYLAT